MSGYSFPFSIADVSYLLNLTVRRKTDYSEQVDCLFCDNHGVGKMRLDYEKNQFNCPRCGQGGGMLKLYSLLANVDTKKAYSDICNHLKIDTKSKDYHSKKVIFAKSSGECVENKIANIEVLDNTFSSLFSILSLTNNHKKNLMNRGLTEEQIIQYGYKSVPTNSLNDIATRPDARRATMSQSDIVTRLLKLGCNLKNVPGFYTDENGNWCVNFNHFSAGILIPYKSVNNQIQGIQIRLDKPYKNAKYKWFSSGEKNGTPLKNGTSSGSPTHFVGNLKDTVVYMTEGALKGTVAHSLSGKSFMCVAGVNQYKSIDNAFKTLKNNGVREIVEAFDMDKYTNNHVEKGCLKLIEKAYEYDFVVHRLKWNEKYKGIDDFLYGKKIKKMEVCL